MNRKLIMALGIFLIIVASAGAGYWLAQAGAPVVAKMQVTADERKPLYWYDPMVPTQHFDKGGKSPFMDMELVPKYADEGGDAAGVKIASGIQQNLAIRIVNVERLALGQSVESVASVKFDDSDVTVVQARGAGFVERVYAHAPGDVVSAGAPLADVLLPDWLAGQTEFLALLGSGDPALLAAGRDRLRLSGMPSTLIDRVERTGKVHAVTTISTPAGGVIQALEVRTGMTLAAGATLARVQGMAKVWLEAAVPEVLAAQIRVGQLGEARFPAYPGEVFKAKVSAILPETNAESHTLRVRIVLPNPMARLRPGMFAQLRLLQDAPAPGLFVPTEAVLHTGQRKVVIIAEADGHFLPAEVEIGREVAGKTEVRKGLLPGQRVVASGQFLIDSEASLSGILARLAASPASTEQKARP